MLTPHPADAPLPVDRYYRDDAVRARMLEYCGAVTSSTPTAAFVVGLEPTVRAGVTWDSASHLPATAMAALWSQAADISRSLWDTEHLLFLIELDYQNPDFPGDPFIHSADMFVKLEPAYRAVTGVFHDLDLHPRILVTGRGYQFTGQIPLNDPLIDELAALAVDTPAWYPSVDARRPPGVRVRLSERQARASAGLGLLIEQAAHVILARAAATSTIPVVFNGTSVGTGRVGRECVSIDFSHVGDPLDVRHVRVAFSAYQWHRIRPDIFGPIASALPPFATIPRTRQSLTEFLLNGRDLQSSRRLAGATRAFLPTVTRGVGRLLSTYQATAALLRFHRRFYEERAMLNGRVRILDASQLPPCLAASLQRPNDLLLKPEHIQHLVRGLLVRGWSAAEIAGLVQSQYEADHGWGDRWNRLHPRTRAEFDVRVFAGLVATRADALVDFNCVSAQEKGLCPRTTCQYDLRQDRDRLLGAQLV